MLVLTSEINDRHVDRVMDRAPNSPDVFSAPWTSSTDQSGANLSSPVEPPLDRGEWLGLAGVTLLAFVLRVVMLGRAALWTDEMCFIIYNVGVDTNPLEAFARHWNTIVGIGHMPLAGTLQNIWYATLGLAGFQDVMHSPALNRVPMIVVGTLAVPGLYIAARTLFDRGPAAWCATMLIACSFYPVYYSREAYCYAYILCFGAWGLAAWVRLWRHGGTWNFIAATLLFTGMALSHLGAVVFVAGSAVVAGLFWLGILFQRAAPPDSRNAFQAAISPAIAFLASSPYLLKFMFNNTAHIGTGQAPPIWIIWNDVVSKMFLGEQPVLAGLAWGVWVAGIVSLIGIRPRNQSVAGALVAASVIVGMVLLGVATLRTQYLSARYFMPLAPGMYLIFGAGLHAIAAVAARGIPWLVGWRATAAEVGLAVCCLIPHLFFFLPLYWVIPDRHEPFQRTAAWLNENVAAGTPYLLQFPPSYRWLGQFYATPGLVPLVPYVRADVGEEDVMRQKQMELCQRIPEAVVVKSWDCRWKWPASWFRHRVIIDNPELRRLVRSGIFPGVPHEHVEDGRYNIEIFFNRPADIAARAREQASGVVIDFPEWVIQGQQISVQETLYFRIPKDAYRAFTIDNVNGRNVAGTLVIEFLIVGAPGQNSDIVVTMNGLEPKAARFEHQKLQRLTLDVPSLEPGESKVFFSLPGGGSGSRTVAVWDVRWMTGAGGPGQPSGDQPASAAP